MGWNVLVAVAAVTMIVYRHKTSHRRSGYQEIGGHDEEADIKDEEVIKEAEKLIEEVQNNLNYTDSYQTL